MKLVDTHAHLAMLQHSPVEEVLDRAKAQGIYRMVTVSTDEASWEPNKALASKYEQLYYSLGLHPHDALQWSACAEKLKSYFIDEKPPHKCVAVGEMGLDFHYDFCPREVQIEAFEAQVTLGKRYGLPLIIHCRDAFEALFASLTKVGMGPRTGVMHCFTGSALEAKKAVELGLKISFSGILTFKTAADLRETAKTIPRQSLLVETDCPYLAPIPHRGKPNEPSFLPMTVQTLAAALGAEPEEIADQTTRNAVEFFQLN